jgi:hypothetical protein
VHQQVGALPEPIRRQLLDQFLALASEKEPASQPAAQ